MTCAEVMAVVEAVAAGDRDVDVELRGHVESCPRCAAALAVAGRIERALAAREAPRAPDRFAANVLQRIRRERWRAEQQVDWLFNATMAIATVLVVGGLVALLNLDGVLAAAAAAWALGGSLGSEAARVAAPSIGTYVAAGGLLVSALAMWWWADRALL